MGELLDLFYAGLVIYFIYKLITGLIMPVSRVSSDMRSKIKQMQEEQMRQQNAASQQQQAASAQPKKSSPAPQGDYIDFEEVK